MQMAPTQDAKAMCAEIVEVARQQSEKIDKLQAEITRLTDQCRLYEAHAYRAQQEAITLVQAAEDKSMAMQRFQNAHFERLVAALRRISNIDDHITAPIAAEALEKT